MIAEMTTSEIGVMWKSIAGTIGVLIVLFLVMAVGFKWGRETGVKP